MQLSTGTLNTPSSRVVKDSTPSWRQILMCIDFGIGESWRNRNFIVLLFCLFESDSWPRKNKNKTSKLGESSPTFIFAAVNLDPIVIEKIWTDGESWPNDFVEKVNRGEDLRWVGSRCPLMHALSKIVTH